MFVLQSKIEIGDFVFTDIHDVKITKSVDLIEDIAVVKLPTSFKVKKDNVLRFTEEVIKTGDAVKITLGYKDVYTGVEFVGYVKKVNPNYPLEIHCEDAMWLLKRKNIAKAWNYGTTLKEVLQEVVKDTSLTLAKNIPDVNFDKYIIRNANGAQVLASFKKKMGMVAFLNDSGELYCGFQQLTNILQEVKYDLNYNIVKNDLEFQTKEDRKIKIRYTYINAENKRKKIVVGDADGALRTFHTSVISDEKQLQKMAQAELEKLKYDGYKGSVTSFLVPYANRGMKAILIDEKYKKRQGDYFIKTVETSFGLNGARRKVILGTVL